jgi:hypothetical protein
MRFVVVEFSPGRNEAAAARASARGHELLKTPPEAIYPPGRGSLVSSRKSLP